GVGGKSAAFDPPLREDSTAVTGLEPPTGRWPRLRARWLRGRHRRWAGKEIGEATVIPRDGTRKGCDTAFRSGIHREAFSRSVLLRHAPDPASITAVRLGTWRWAAR